jgi:hypothetical protein
MMTQVDAGGAEEVRRSINEICAQMTVHEEAGDKAARKFFENLLSEDFAIRRLDGPQDKQRFIDELPKHSGRQRRDEAPEIRTWDDVAVASLVISTPSGSGATGGPPAGRDAVRNIRIFRRRAASDGSVAGVGGWVLFMWHNSRATSPP